VHPDAEAALTPPASPPTTVSRMATNNSGLDKIVLPSVARCWASWTLADPSNEHDFCQAILTDTLLSSQACMPLKRSRRGVCAPPAWWAARDTGAGRMSQQSTAVTQSAARGCTRATRRPASPASPPPLQHATREYQNQAPRESTTALGLDEVNPRDSRLDNHCPEVPFVRPSPKLGTGSTLR
jgi:hypothetical protein